MKSHTGWVGSFRHGIWYGHNRLQKHMPLHMICTGNQSVLQMAEVWKYSIPSQVRHGTWPNFRFGFTAMNSSPAVSSTQGSPAADRLENGGVGTQEAEPAKDADLRAPSEAQTWHQGLWECRSHGVGTSLKFRAWLFEAMGWEHP